MNGPAEAIVNLSYYIQFLTTKAAIAAGDLKSFIASASVISFKSFPADNELFKVKWLPGLYEYTIIGVVNFYHVYSYNLSFND